MATMPSLLDNLGEEVTGIMAPVSLCMAVTVLLVRLLNPEGASSANSVIIASVAYQEQASDSSGKKLGGALLNAIIFVAIIAGMTIILFLLFKYKCYKFIYAYMGFAVFNIFFFLTGALFIQVMQVINLHIDAFSLAYGLFNFSVIGTLGLLFVPIPLLMKQLYLIWVGIIVAYIFTFIPEWTAWVILVFMALYDIAAVLIPGGPLKALVEMAIDRKQELPALIYEARPAGGRPYVRGWGNRTPAAAVNGDAPEGAADGTAPGPGPGAPRPVAEAAGAPGSGSPTAAPTSVEMRRPASRPSRLGSGAGSGCVSGGWVSGPSRTSLAAPQAASITRLGGAGSGDASEGDAGPAIDSIRSFVSLQGQDLQEQQEYSQQPRRVGASAGGAQGSRPVAEGRELDGETWELLPSGAPGEEGGARADTLRQRLSRVLSASGQRDSGAAADSSSNTSQEPLIEPGSSERPQQQPSLQAGRVSGVVPGDGGSHPRASGGVGPRGSVHPSTPSGSRSVSNTNYGGPVANSGFESFPLKSSPQSLRPSLTQSPASARESATNMGVRAVPPALSKEQLAQAVRVRAMSEAPLQQQQLEPAGHPPGGIPTPTGVALPGTPPAVPPPDDEQRRDRDHDGEGEGLEADLPDAIKLGLGDFIFYSMLVGRAAMYDFMTVFSSFLAIIAGLGLTLLCLAIYQKALPALPFSIALGVAFYFLTRLTLEPFLVPMSVHLTYY